MLRTLWNKRHIKWLQFRMWLGLDRQAREARARHATFKTDLARDALKRKAAVNQLALGTVGTTSDFGQIDERPGFEVRDTKPLVTEDSVVEYLDMDDPEVAEFCAKWNIGGDPENRVDREMDEILPETTTADHQAAVMAVLRRREAYEAAMPAPESPVEHRARVGEDTVTVFQTELAKRQDDDAPDPFAGVRNL